MNFGLGQVGCHWTEWATRMGHQLLKLDIPDNHIQQLRTTDSRLLSRTRHFDAFLLLLISVKFSIRTTYSHISFMSLFGGGSVVVLGKEAESGQCKLIQYNLNIGDVICNRDVEEEPDGMTDIVFNGKPLSCPGIQVLFVIFLVLLKFSQNELNFYFVGNSSPLRKHDFGSKHNINRNKRIFCSIKCHG